ncbi:MAG: hypothetical protein K6G90_09445 [Clostridia bacterium]|nr:hypothetical protein [Clostridia bacterium]
MDKDIKRIVTGVISLILLLPVISLLLILPAGAEADGGGMSASVYETYAGPGERLLIVSNKGYRREYPENSLDAVKRAAELGADIVKIDLQTAADGGFTLSSGETLLSVLEREDLSCMLMLSDAWQNRDALYGLVKDKYLDRVIFQFEGVKPDETAGWMSGLDAKPEVCLWHKGNVVFGARSFVRKSAEAGISSLWLASRVPYSISFSKAVTAPASGNSRLMLDLTDGENSGRLRADSQVWYDEALCRGFNMILTDDVPGAKRYLERCENAREALAAAFDSCVNGFTLPDFTSDVYASYKKAYDLAKADAEILLSDGGAAASEMENAAAALYRARDNIVRDYDELKTGKAGVTVTPGRIAAAVIAVAAVCAFEIFIYKRKQK